MPQQSTAQDRGNLIASKRALLQKWLTDQCDCAQEHQIPTLPMEWQGPHQCLLNEAEDPPTLRVLNELASSASTTSTVPFLSSSSSRSSSRTRNRRGDPTTPEPSESHDVKGFEGEELTLDVLVNEIESWQARTAEKQYHVHNGVSEIRPLTAAEKHAALPIWKRDAALPPRLARNAAVSQSQVNIPPVPPLPAEYRPFNLGHRAKQFTLNPGSPLPSPSVTLPITVPTSNPELLVSSSLPSPNPSPRPQSRTRSVSLANVTNTDRDTMRLVSASFNERSMTAPMLPNLSSASSASRPLYERRRRRRPHTSDGSSCPPPCPTIAIPPPLPRPTVIHARSVENIRNGDGDLLPSFTIASARERPPPRSPASSSSTSDAVEVPIFDTPMILTPATTMTCASEDDNTIVELVGDSKPGFLSTVPYPRIRTISSPISSPHRNIRPLDDTASPHSPYFRFPSPSPSSAGSSPMYPSSPPGRNRSTGGWMRLAKLSPSRSRSSSSASAEVSKTSLCVKTLKKGVDDVSAFENVRQWCKTYGEVMSINRSTGRLGALRALEPIKIRVEFRDSSVYDKIFAVYESSSSPVVGKQATIMIDGVGLVEISLLHH